MDGKPSIKFESVASSRDRTVGDRVGMPNLVWRDFFPTPKNKVNSMANLLRSAKSGNNWTANELLAYNIEVQHATTTAFFNTVDLPETSVSETILNNLQEPAGPLSKIERKFFQLMADVEYPCAEVAAVNDFAVFLLSLLDYDHDDRRLHTDKEMTFYMAGQHVGAKADVVLMDTERFLLLILEEDKVSCHLASASCLTHGTQIRSAGHQLPNQSTLLRPSRLLV